MPQTSLQMAEDHILSHHNAADGWITLAQKTGGRFRQWHYQPDELARNLEDWTGENVYFSQNTFYTTVRRTDTIRQLRSLYVDLDVYTKGLDPEWVLGKLELEAFGQTIPNPNVVIFSGRGLVLVWHIEPVPYQALPLWKAVENHFANELRELGADSKATDPARIFRVAGTINSKSGTMVKTEYRHTYKYELRQLQFDYLPELAQTQERPRGRQRNVVRLYNTYTLHIARAKDIATIVSLRNGNVTGMRNNICFLYRYFTCCFTEDPEQALADTLSLNEEFTQPLPEREVMVSTRSAEKAWKERDSKAAIANSKRKGYAATGYNYSNKSLIEMLQITPEEQRELLTIIGPGEKRRRDLKAKEEKRRESGIPTRDTYLAQERAKTEEKLQQIRAHLEVNPEDSIRQIAEKTGLSWSAVQRLKSRI